MEAATAQQPRRQPQADHAALLGALVVVLLSGLPPASMAAFATSVLAPLGISAEAAQKAIGLISPHAEAADVRAIGQAAGWVEQTRIVRHAAYALNAGRRLTADPSASSLASEQRHLRAHLNAERGRRAAAIRIDSATAVYGPVLGWYAIRDDRTDPICRAASGKNFRPVPPPAIGMPGAVHPFCRCSPGPPHEGAEVMA